MRVLFITISDDAGPNTYQDEIDEALKVGANNAKVQRVAFGGRTDKGRAGIALDLSTGTISGHKIDAIPAELVPLVRHVPTAEARQGLGYLLAGEDVLIGSEEHGVLLRRFGEGIEVFGSGEDSYRPLL